MTSRPAATLVAAQWSELMTPWENPRSLADGILDDETYDWLGVFDAIGGWGDAPVVAAEADIIAAHQLARARGSTSARPAAPASPDCSPPSKRSNPPSASPW